MSANKPDETAIATAHPQSLKDRFEAAQPHLSRSRKRLVEAILSGAEETFFLSSRDLAKRFQIDVATVVRTVQALGYERFADFSADLRQHFVSQIKPYTAMKVATQKRRSVSNRIALSLEADLENLNAVKFQTDAERVTEAAKLIHRARQVFVVGIDLSAPLAEYFAFGLRTLGLNAVAPVGSTANMRITTRLLTSKDLLIGISFGRCVRETVEAVLRAREENVPTFGVTDGDRTPIARYSDFHFVASIAGTSFLPSFTAPTALVNAILVACAHVRPQHSFEILEQNERDLDSGSLWYEETEPPGSSRSNGRHKERSANLRKSG